MTPSKFASELINLWIGNRAKHTHSLSLSQTHFHLFTILSFSYHSLSVYFSLCFVWVNRSFCVCFHTSKFLFRHSNLFCLSQSINKNWFSDNELESAGYDIDVAWTNFEWCMTPTWKKKLEEFSERFINYWFVIFTQSKTLKFSSYFFLDQHFL